DGFDLQPCGVLHPGEGCVDVVAHLGVLSVSGDIDGDVVVAPADDVSGGPAVGFGGYVKSGFDELVAGGEGVGGGLEGLCCFGTFCAEFACACAGRHVPPVGGDTEVGEVSERPDGGGDGCRCGDGGDGPIHVSHTHHRGCRRQVASSRPVMSV